MGHPEKDPKINPKDAEGPKLDAIFPDDLPPAAAELVGDIDNYHKRMEDEWEKAKSSYEEKINRIMEDFSAKPITPPEPEPYRKQRSTSNENRLARLMAEVERELEESTRKNKRFSFAPHRVPDPFQLPWQGAGRYKWLQSKAVAAATLVVLSSMMFYGRNISVQVTPLPYTHTLGPIVWKNNICILDWFRKALYVHEDKAGFPIKSVEPVLNNLATGIAASDKIIWSLDSLDRKILSHTTTSEHTVTASADVPDTKPTGLFFDGTDLWMADQDSMKLYRLRGNDLEDVRDSFPLPQMTVTGIAFHENKLWILDGKSRLVNVYRLQKPMLQLGSFDLDPFVKGAAPTGMAFLGNKILVVTENPPTLTRIPLFRLKHSKTEVF